MIFMILCDARVCEYLIWLYKWNIKLGVANICHKKCIDLLAEVKWTHKAEPSI